jgi:uncharacterized phage protein (TIGR02220 family)
MNYRNVATAIWTDDAFLSMSPEQKLLFLYLHISPYSTSCGIFKLKPKTMAFQIGLSQEPFESALRGLCSAWPDFVAVDWDSSEVALLQFPRQLLIQANGKTMAIVEKDLRHVESQALLQAVIAQNSASLSKPYLSQLRRLQMQKINELDVNTFLHGDVALAADNQQDAPLIEIEREIEKKRDIVVFEENDATPLDSKAPSGGKRNLGVRKGSKEPSEMVKKVVDYLNSKTGRSFQYGTRSTVQNITRQEKAGRAYADFCTVIDYKTAEWLSDPEFSKHLNPETLFGNKMEKYLNAALALPPSANTDAALNDAALNPALEEKFSKYITWVIEKLPTLYRSGCKAFSKRDYLDYHECASMPGLRFALTPRDKYELLQSVHRRLNDDKRYRERYATALEAFYAEAKAMTQKMQLP